MGEHIMKLHLVVGQFIELEPAAQSILKGWEKTWNLPRGTGDESREARTFDVDMKLLAHTVHGNGFVMIHLAQTVGVVAIVGTHHVGHSVGLSLKHDAPSPIGIKGTIYG